MKMQNECCERFMQQIDQLEKTIAAMKELARQNLNNNKISGDILAVSEDVAKLATTVEQADKEYTHETL